MFFSLLQGEGRKEAACISEIFCVNFQYSGKYNLFYIAGTDFL